MKRLIHAVLFAAFFCASAQAQNWTDGQAFTLSQETTLSFGTPPTITTKTFPAGSYTCGRELFGLSNYSKLAKVCTVIEPPVVCDPNPVTSIASTNRVGGWIAYKCSEDPARTNLVVWRWDSVTSTMRAQAQAWRSSGGGVLELRALIAASRTGNPWTHPWLMEVWAPDAERIEAFKK